MQTVSVIVANFNGARTIGNCLESVYASGHPNFEVILVDDGSTDKTFLKAKECAEKYNFLKVAVHKRNRGLTDALMTGFSKARGKIFVFWPADLQYLPEDIPKLVDRIDNGYDVVCGWRKARQDKLLKAILSKTGNILQRLFTGMKIQRFPYL